VSIRTARAYYDFDYLVAVYYDVAARASIAFCRAAVAADFCRPSELCGRTCRRRERDDFSRLAKNADDEEWFMKLHKFGKDLTALIGDDLDVELHVEDRSTGEIHKIVELAVDADRRNVFIVINSDREGSGK
jgi:hypothetical protein